VGVHEDGTVPDQNYKAHPGETIEALIERVADYHPDLTSIVLVAIRDGQPA
jgi:hypothetical protein